MIIIRVCDFFRIFSIVVALLLIVESVVGDEMSDVYYRASFLNSGVLLLVTIFEILITNLLTEYFRLIYISFRVIYAVSAISSITVGYIKGKSYDCDESDVGCLTFCAGVMIALADALEVSLMSI